MRGAVAGFTLVEVIVASVLLTVGLLASVSMMSLAARTLGEARRTSLAAAAAESLADSLIGVAGEAGRGRRELAWGVLRWEPGERAREVRIEAVAPGTAGVAGESEAWEGGRVIVEMYLRLPPAAPATGPEG